MKNLITKTLGIAGITALSFLPMKNYGQCLEITQTNYWGGNKHLKIGGISKEKSNADTSKQEYKPRQVYPSGSLASPLISFANVKENGINMHNIPRFSMFWNMSINGNYDFNRYLGIFSGLNLKNIGLITKKDNEKLKRRVYTFGASLGFKVGDLKKDIFACFGGAYDLSLNYKQKKFIDGDKKEKFKGFSNRVPATIPSLFAGLQIGGFGLKVQYYPNNFFNKDFEEKVNETIIKPYENLDAKLFAVTFGYEF